MVMFVSAQLYKYRFKYPACIHKSIVKELNTITFIERISELQRQGQMSGNSKTQIT